jgi:hypothetical protein
VIATAASTLGVVFVGAVCLLLGFIAGVAMLVKAAANADERYHEERLKRIEAEHRERLLENRVDQLMFKALPAVREDSAR